MKVHNLSPFPFGVVVTSTEPPQPQMSCIVRGRFKIEPGGVASLREGPEGIDALEQGAMSAEVYRDDDLNGECIYPGDFADLKLNAEVMLRGSCHVPGGAPRAECPVRLAVGDWSKSLRVVGPRRWTDKLVGSAVSEPEPFTTMPIDHVHAFGGPGYDRNPVGRGLDTDELPNLEYPAQPLQSRSDRLRPASFGPRSPQWPQRTHKIGKRWGKSYQEQRAPFYAEDFDWTFFHAAPTDQQLEGYLQGDEIVTLQNLHPEHAVLETRLPGLRMRVFVKGTDGRFREVTMRLDTLWVDADAESLLLTWRGLDEVAEDDLSDVAFALVASESLDDEPRTLDHYRAELEAFEADPTGLEQAQQQVLEQMSAELDEAAGDAPQAEVGADPVTALLSQASGGRELPGQKQLAAIMQRMLQQADPKTREAIAKAAKEATSVKPSAPLTPAKPGTAPRVALGELLGGLKEAAVKLREQAVGAGIDPGAFEKIDQLMDHPDLRVVDPALCDEADVGADEPGPGADLHGRDLTGRDLRGADLSGANLRGALLSQADLRGVSLRGANLDYAVLHEARLDEADLSEVHAHYANFASVRAAGVRLERAELECASFSSADLREAVLDQARGDTASFAKADLSASSGKQAVFTDADFEDAVLERADWSQAELQSCLLLRARGAHWDLEGATLSKSSFAEADLSDARLERVEASPSIWLKTRLVGASLRLARLRGAQLHECVADRIDGYGADLRDAVLYRASLAGAQLRRANLFGVDLRKAQLTDASFRDANLYDAKLLGAAGRGTDFQGANLERAAVKMQ